MTTHIVITYFMRPSLVLEGSFLLVPILFKALPFWDDLVNYRSHLNRGTYMNSSHQMALPGTLQSEADVKVS